MKVFLAGATGAIGRRLVPQLVETGHQVIAMTRSKEKLGELYELGAEPVLCDVFDAGRLGSVVARAEPEAVINELTDLPQSLNPRKLKEYYAANNRVRREGTRNLLSAARGAGVRRFLLQGSAYWYAPTGGPVKSEEAPFYLDAPAPIGPAVETIKEVEDAVLSAEGIEGVVLRYGMFYGPGTWYAEDGDVGRQVRKRRYPMIGNGEGTYSFIHVDDAASATVAALERARPGVYNVVDDEPATAAEWMPVYAEALGAKRPPRVPAFAARVLAGLSEGPLGTRLFVDQRSGENGELAWRDVADEEPDGHQLAYVTEELLAADGTGPGEMVPGDFEMAAQTDVGFAVLVAKGDPEVETLQWQDFEDFGDFVEAAKEEPGLVEVADPGADTVYRAGTLTLEREAGVDLLPRSPANKTPIQAIYDADVEAALVPLEAVVLSDVLAGELEALAVFGDGRCPDLPGVPTAKELGYDVTVPVFGGIAAPAGTPPRVVDEIGRAFVASSSSRTFERALAGSGRVPMQRGSGEFARYVEEQSRFLSETVSGATKGE